MSKRIHRERGMPQHNGGTEEPNNEPAPTGNEKAGEAQPDGADDVVIVHPTQLRELSEVLDCVVVRFIESAGNNPAHVAPPKPVLWGMRIPVRVRIPMVIPVMSSPPKRTLLHSREPAQRHHKLSNPAQFVGTVGKVPVISRRDEEDSGEVQHDAQDHGSFGDSRKEGE
jgi:hypothetical protein